MMPAMPTNVPTPSQEAQGTVPAGSPAPYAEPKEPPSKGSPDAKVTILWFCDFI
jgi:hypothetical protein